MMLVPKKGLAIPPSQDTFSIFVKIHLEKNFD